MVGTLFLYGMARKTISQTVGLIRIRLLICEVRGTRWRRSCGVVTGVINTPMSQVVNIATWQNRTNEQVKT